MKEHITIGFATFVLVLIIPYVVTFIWSGVPAREASANDLNQIQTGKTVSIEYEGKYEIIDVEMYLRGVLPGIMEPTKDIELWKAIAVAERTNIYRQMFGSASVDNDELMEEYMSDEEIRHQWGERNFVAIMPIIEKAIIETVGCVMKYDDEYIYAYYHGISVGTTVSAEELLGEAIPYLVEVDSGHDVEAKDYMTIINLPEDEIDELTINEATEHGYIQSVNYNGETLTAQEACEKWGIPSYYFYIEDMREQMSAYRIVALGKGHGMGMSLYGAGCLSRSGKDYLEILEYYYPNVQIVP